MEQTPDCQCFYCRNNLLDPEEEQALEESIKEIEEQKRNGTYRTYTIDEYLKLLDDL
jgi:hypothetical protein